MEPLLIDFNKKAYDEQIGRLETFSTLFEQAIELFNSFGFGKFESDDLNDLILKTDEYIYRKTVENKDLSLLKNMGLEEAKIIEMLKKPIGLETLHEKIELVNRIFKRDVDRLSHVIGKNIKELLRRFSFDKGKMIIKEEYCERFRKYEETYIETEEAINLFSFATEVIKLSEKYKIKGPLAGPASVINLLFNSSDNKTQINLTCVTNVENQAKRHR